MEKKYESSVNSFILGNKLSENFLTWINDINDPSIEPWGTAVSTLAQGKYCPLR